MTTAPRPPSVRAALRVALALFAGVAAAHAAFSWDPTPWLAWLPPCPTRTATGVPCPGCGMSRALLLLARLRLAEAWAMHPAAPLLVAAAAALAVGPARLEPRLRRRLGGAAVAALLGIWAARGLGHLPPLPSQAPGPELSGGPLARAPSRR